MTYLSFLGFFISLVLLGVQAGGAFGDSPRAVQHPDQAPARHYHNRLVRQQLTELPVVNASTSAQEMHLATRGGSAHFTRFKPGP